MAGIRPIALTEFYRSLHARGESTESLARQLNISGGAVRRLIGMLRRRHGIAWRGLQQLLTDRERRLLMDVEQCSAWNIRQQARRPRWTDEKEARLAS